MTQQINFKKKKFKAAKTNVKKKKKNKKEI